MNLHTRPFNLIKKGEKKIESRLYDDKRKTINIGDEIVFTLINDATQTIHVVVKELLVKKSFQELFNSKELSLFGYKYIEDSLSIYTYYSKIDEEKYGVLGIVFQVV